jgi:hypothetical protein
MRPATIYEITFAGEAGEALRAAFDDCKITTRSGRTTLRVELTDPVALFGLVERIRGLGLEVTGLHRMAPGPH